MWCIDLSNDELIILKLGGSLLTYKDKPLKAKKKAIRSLANFLAKNIYPVKKKLVLIHGGGSFGHYEALMDIQKHGKLTYSGFPKISLSMVLLNEIVLRELIRVELPIVSIPPRAICYYDCELSEHVCNYNLVNYTIENNLIPLLFGDVIVGKGNCTPHIISGDDIAIDIAKLFGTAKIIFAMDVDGIYQPTVERGLGSLIKRINLEEANSLIKELEKINKIKGYDVTGGIVNKLRKSIECIRNNYCKEIIFVSGEKKDLLYKAIMGVPGEYTILKIE